MSRTLGIKLGTIALLILLLLIPLSMIEGLVEERQALRDEVVRVWDALLGSEPTGENNT